MDASLGTHSRRSSRSSRRRTNGPSLDGAAPAMRASERNVLLVATTWRGSPDRAMRPVTSAMVARTCLRSALTCVGPRRVLGEEAAREPTGTQRQRDGDVGRLVRP